MKKILPRVLRWTIYIIIAILGATIIMLYSLSVWRNSMTPDDLRLFPEPRLSSFITGGYAFDEQATVDHYNQFFAGKVRRKLCIFLKKTIITSFLIHPMR